jgi:hypothetical protein
MKRRTCFVSNSSSSSFTLFYENDDVLDTWCESLAVPAGHPLKDLVGVLSKRVRDNVKNAEVIVTKKELEDYYCELPEEELGYIEKGWKIRVGSFADDEDSIEAMLCNVDLNVEGPGWKFVHFGGY